MKPIEISAYRQIVVLTGAGISVASGIRPFRGPGGIWEDLDPLVHASRRTLDRDPSAIWKFFGPLRDQLRTARPNPAHQKLAELEASLRPDQRFTLITQNIDGLHQQAGSRSVIEYHGTIRRTRCTRSACPLAPYEDADPHTGSLPCCPRCGAPLRPDFVLFGELIPEAAARRSLAAVQACDLFLAVGTSGTVYPAAEFVRLAAAVGARTLLVNLEPSGSPFFQEEILGRAEEILPQLW